VANSTLPQQTFLKRRCWVEFFNFAKTERFIKQKTGKLEQLYNILLAAKFFLVLLIKEKFST